MHIKRFSIYKIDKKIFIFVFISTEIKNSYDRVSACLTEKRR